ncbi:MAG: hypothetical protein A2135_05380 [Actinobacteria bacterium RBG_16_67_15]|nr:MAG: hypothetical protein A2135_05380 [Actinobacteria bacterium RBG_16_67_15]
MVAKALLPPALLIIWTKGTGALELWVRVLFTAVVLAVVIGVAGSMWITAAVNSTGAERLKPLGWVVCTAGLLYLWLIWRPPASGERLRESNL